MGTGVRQKISYGPRGKGSISILPVKNAKQSRENWNDVKVVIHENGEKNVYHLDPDDLTTEFGDWSLETISDVRVELTHDEENLRSVRPWEGTYILEFDRFVARLDEKGNPMAPTIKHKMAKQVNLPDGRSWTNPPYDEFYAILKIRAGEIGKPSPFDGMEVLKPLAYMFERDATTGLVEIAWTRKRWYEELENFMTLAGYDWDADNLTPSENVLGELQEILQARAEIFRGTFKDGWLDRVLDNPPVGVTL